MRFLSMAAPGFVAVAKGGSAAAGWLVVTVALWPVSADSLFSGLGLGAVVGLGLAALLLVLVAVDVSCFFLRQCGLLMCITKKLCGKKSATSSKSKDMEEGKAAYL